MRHLLSIAFLLVVGFLPAQELVPTKILDQSDGLFQNTVLAIEQDELGRIWIGSPSGALIYDGFTVEPVPQIDSQVISLHCVDEWVYCLCLIGVFKFHSHRGLHSSFIFDKADYYRGYYEDEVFFVVSSDGEDVLSFNDSLKPDKSLEEKFDSSKLSKFFGNEIELAGLKISQGVNGASYFDTESHLITSDYCNRAVCYSDSCAFITSNVGLFRIQLKNDSVKVNQFFENERIESVLIDHDDNLWLGTSEKGLYMVHRNAFQSEFYPTRFESEGVAAWILFDVDGKLVCPTSKGLQYLDQNAKENNLEQLTLERFCISGIQLANGDVCIGTIGDGALICKGESIESAFVNEDETLDNTVMQFVRSNEKIYATTKRSLLVFNEEGNLLNQYTYDQFGIGSYCMHLDTTSDGFRMFLTNGIAFFDADFNLKRHRKTDEARVFTWGVNFKGKDWFGSLDGGLYIYENDEFVPSKFSFTQVLGLYNDQDQFLWVSTSTGLYRFDGERTLPFLFPNGIPVKEFNQGGFYKSEDMILHSGYEGVIGLNLPIELRASALPSYSISGISIDSLVELEHDESTLSFDFHPIVVSDHNLFEFHFEVNDQKLVVDHPQKIILQIPYGDSDLKVTTLNKFTGDSIDTIYEVNRKEPIWNKLWFKLIILCLSILAVFGLFSWWKVIQTKKQLEDERQKNQVVKERLRISRELHDNIGTRLSHIISSLDVEMYAGKTSPQLESINAFARDTMSQLRETIWAVSDKSIFFSELASKIKQYVTGVGQLSGIDIGFLQDQIDDFELSSVQTINFYRIVQEAVTNAVKYAHSQDVFVELKDLGEKVSIEIIDGGQGMSEEMKNQGSGLNNMKVRAEEARAELVLTSQLGEGTHIQVIFAKN